VATRLDGVLADAPELPSAEDHVRRCCTAAAALAPIAARTAPVRCDGGAPHAVAWRFGEDAVTVVNVGGETAQVAVDAPAGRLRDAVDGTAELASTIDVPAHTLRVFVRRST
jgi:hypothetical protein